MKSQVNHEERINAMWRRAIERVDGAIENAPNTTRWRKAVVFSQGFWYALALLARERRIRELFAATKQP